MSDYLTVDEACELARISRTTFYKLLDDERSGLARTVIRIPGLARLRVPERRFREWLEGRPAKPRAGPGHRLALRPRECQPCPGPVGPEGRN